MCNDMDSDDSELKSDLEGLDTECEESLGKS